MMKKLLLVLGGSLAMFFVVATANAEFESGGYLTQVDIYLDVDAHSENDLRFDWLSAISSYGEDSSCSPRRDFVFNCGWYDDLDSGKGFVCSASNETPGLPKNPGKDPVEITKTGWYTFKHTFRDDGSGTLAVDMEIVNENGKIVGFWTLSDPSDIIGETIGGNRYGWFAKNQLGMMAIDNTKRCDYSGCVFQQGFETDDDRWDETASRVASGTNGIASSEGDFHAEITGEDFTYWGGPSCQWPIEPPFERLAKVIFPVEGETVFGTAPLDVELYDKDGDDEIEWGVRKGTCEEEGEAIFGNIDGLDDEPDRWDGYMFHAEVNTLNWEDGSYCFIFDPSESDGDTEIREERDFVTDNTPDDVSECKKYHWRYFQSRFKNQGQCVSWLQSNENSKKEKK